MDAQIWYAVWVSAFLPIWLLLSVSGVYDLPGSVTSMRWLDCPIYNWFGIILLPIIYLLIPLFGMGMYTGHIIRILDPVHGNPIGAVFPCLVGAVVGHMITGWVLPKLDAVIGVSRKGLCAPISVMYHVGQAYVGIKLAKGIVHGIKKI